MELKNCGPMDVTPASVLSGRWAIAGSHGAVSRIAHHSEWETGWPNIVNKLVTDRAELATVALLRREAYRASGAEAPAEILADPLDEARNSRVFLLRHDGQPVGTIRTLTRNLDSNLPTAFSSRFAREIAEQVGDAGFVEITRLAIRHTGPAQYPRYAFALMQNGTAEADRSGSRYILAPIREGHLSFYRSLGFEAISDPRWIAGWTESITLVCLDWTAQRNRLRGHRRFARLFSARNERALTADQTCARQERDLRAFARKGWL